MRTSYFLFDTVKRGNLKLETLETLTLFRTNKKLLEDNIIEVDNESDGDSDKEESDMDNSEDECDVMETVAVGTSVYEISFLRNTHV